ncbi:Hypothetical predicted protein [Pelobates cultripes]|uniref:Uncharacterized protein n=1 Tax=Pelobates cultripes TaxID=61616 RepID=A0AAD1TA25_PELCU|nr:Hypothetical predicted protein [Pelobates cultripes]
MMTNTNRNQMTERILDLTLEVNYLLTGEEYIVVKRPSKSLIQSCSPHVSEEPNRPQSPIVVPSPIPNERKNNQKILELTNRIIYLLTGEVWKYLEGHEEPFKDMMTETPQPLWSLGKRRPCLHVML